MEYLVTMTTHVPDGTSEEAVSDVRAREAVRSRELAAQGHLLRLWRPPLQPGEWRTLGLFAAGDDGQLEQVLASMPLRVWRTDEVTPLSPHRNDPGPSTRAARRSPAAEENAMTSKDQWVAAITRGSKASAPQSAAGIGLHAISAGSVNGLHADVVA